MRHARDVLAKQEYDPETRAVDEVITLVDQHNKRRLKDRINHHKKSLEEAQLSALLE